MKNKPNNNYRYGNNEENSIFNGSKNVKRKNIKILLLEEQNLIKICTNCIETMY